MYTEVRATGEAGAQDLARVYADFAHRLTYDALPSDIVEIIKKLVLDQLGVLVLGSSAAGVDTLVEAGSEWGGKPEATVLIHGARMPADRAALINGTMARALDYDAVHEGAIVHITAGIVPQALVMAERSGPISGRDFIAALAAGMELMIRLGLTSESVFLHTGRITTLHQATFGGALAAAKLLRFSPDRTVAALGIAYAQVAGTLQMAREGSVLVRVQQGFADQASIVAAVLAEKGLGSIQNVFQGEFGYFNAYLDGKCDLGVMTRNLGKEYEIRDISVKYYPCCFLTHFSIDAMRQLVAAHKFKADDVESIDIRVTKGTYNSVCAPIEAKRNVTSTQEALFSVPYTTATALIHGAVKLEHMLDPSAIGDPAVRALANKVSIEIDAELEAKYGRVIGPSIVNVALKDGRKLSQRVDLCKGHPKNPMSFDDCEAKFWSCLPYAAKPLDRKKAETVVAKVRSLESMDDVAGLVSYLI